MTNRRNNISKRGRVKIMIYYDVTIDCNNNLLKNLVKMSSEKKPELDACIMLINKHLSLVSKEGVELYITGFNETSLDAVLAEKIEDIENRDPEKIIKIYLKKLSLKIKNIIINEIDVKNFSKRIEQANDENYLYSSDWWTIGQYRYNYFDNNYFTVKESILEGDSMDCNLAKEKAKFLMSDQTMFDC